MSAGIVQLIAIGAQDEYIVGNPEISFFSSTFKRHANFSQSTEKQTILGAVKNNSLSSIQIEKTGDLLGHVYMVVDNMNESLQIEDWTTLVDKVELLIGGSVIDTQDSIFTEKIKVVKHKTFLILNKIDLINENLKSKNESLNLILESINAILLDIPNIPHESTPDGKNESENVVLRTVGKITSSNKVDHIDLTTKIDTDLAAKLAGSRFAVLKGSLAKLQRALISLMLDTAQKNGYEEYYLPYMANKDSLIGTGNLPKFEEDLFKTSESLYLIPTAEVPLTNIYRDVLIDNDELPIKLTAHTPCFRSEAGSYGRDTKGL